MNNASNLTNVSLTDSSTVFTVKEYTIESKRNKFVAIDFDPKAVIKSSSDVSNILRAIMDKHVSIYEAFYVLFLNNSNKVVGYYKASVGGINATVVDERLIMKVAINLLTCKMVLSHNHPSGTLQPSSADRSITEKLRKACSYFSIELLDHLIITEDSYYSFKDEGEL